MGGGEKRHREALCCLDEGTQDGGMYARQPASHVAQSQHLCRQRVRLSSLQRSCKGAQVSRRVVLGGRMYSRGGGIEGKRERGGRVEENGG